MRPVEASRRISDKPRALAFAEREAERLRYPVTTSVQLRLDGTCEASGWLDEGGNPDLGVTVDTASEDFSRFDVAGIHSSANLNALSWCQEPRQPEYPH